MFFSGLIEKRGIDFEKIGLRDSWILVGAVLHPLHVFYQNPLPSWVTVTSY